MLAPHCHGFPFFVRFYSSKLVLSAVASPKFFQGGQTIWFSANDIILFGIPPLKAQMTIYAKNLVGAIAPAPPPCVLRSRSTRGTNSDKDVQENAITLLCRHSRHRGQDFAVELPCLSKPRVHMSKLQLQPQENVL